jgi:hypothetical protein
VSVLLRKLGLAATAFGALASLVLIMPGSALAGLIPSPCQDAYAFSSDTYSVHGGQSATITIDESRNFIPPASCGTTSMDYATSDGTAHAPADYTPKNGQASFPSNSYGGTTTSDTHQDQFSVATSASAHAGSTFNVALSNPQSTSGTTFAFAGSPSSATVTITDGAPFATTGGATNITSSGATLNGSVNPNRAATTYSFQYGTSTSYGSQTASQSAGSGTSDQPASAGISGLVPGTTYHFRIVATNSDGTTFGSDATFTTQSSYGPPESAPSATTGPATGVKSSGAAVTGTVNPNGQATTYHFEWGTSTAYGHTTPSTSAGAGTTSQSVSAALSGLAPSTTYHYRIVASNASGTTTGADRKFTTPKRPYAGAFAPGQQDPLTGPGAVKVLVVCPAGTFKTCTGTLQLSFGGTVIGSASFKLRSGQSVRLNTRLSAHGLALVHKHGALAVRAHVRSHDAAGTRRTRNSTITLLAPAPTPVRVLPKFTG